MIPSKIKFYCVAGLCLALVIAILNERFIIWTNHLLSYSGDTSKKVEFQSIIYSSLDWRTETKEANENSQKPQTENVIKGTEHLDSDSLPLNRFSELQNILKESFQKYPHDNVTTDLTGNTYPVLQIGKPPQGNVTRIALLGERNSGTQWMFSELNKCFNHTLKVTRDLTRYKHWFQHDDGRSHNPVLVVAQFRDPYFWTAAMVEKPHHSPLHVGLRWKKFVTKPWTMPRPERDLPLKNSSGPVCQQNFHYNEIVSCVPGHKPANFTKPNKRFTFYSGHQPQYELMLNGDGEAYHSILQLRADKIVNFLNVSSWDYVSNVMVVQYERLVSQGTLGLVKQIEDLTGVSAACPPVPPQHRPIRRLNKNFVRWISDHADWSVENLIGYEKDGLIAENKK